MSVIDVLKARIDQVRKNVERSLALLEVLEACVECVERFDVIPGAVKHYVVRSGEKRGQLDSIVTLRDGTKHVLVDFDMRRALPPREMLDRPSAGEA